jgi:hypothetical protein
MGIPRNDFAAPVRRAHDWDEDSYREDSAFWASQPASVIGERFRHTAIDAHECPSCYAPPGKPCFASDYSVHPERAAMYARNPIAATPVRGEAA